MCSFKQIQMKIDIAIWASAHHNLIFHVFFFLSFTFFDFGKGHHKGQGQPSTRHHGYSVVNNSQRTSMN